MFGDWFGRRGDGELLPARSEGEGAFEGEFYSL